MAATATLEFQKDYAVVPEFNYIAEVYLLFMNKQKSLSNYLKTAVDF